MMHTIARRPFSARQRRKRKTLAGIMFFAGFAVSVWAIGVGLHTHSLEQPVAGGVETTGTVVGYRVAQEWDGHYRPVVAFTDGDGRRIVFSAPAQTRPPAVGRVASVSYDPRNPTNAHDLSDTALWREQFYVGVFGLAVLLSMIVLVTWLNRRARSRRQAAATPPHASY